MQDLEERFGLPLTLVPVGEDELRDAIRQTVSASASLVELVRDLTADCRHDR